MIATASGQNRLFVPCVTIICQLYSGSSANSDDRARGIKEELGKAAAPLAWHLEHDVKEWPIMFPLRAKLPCLSLAAG